MIAANRVGTEGQGGADGGPMSFYGSSFVADARGELVADLSRTETGPALATLDLAALRRQRASMGFFRDRRPSLYGPLGR